MIWAVLDTNVLVSGFGWRGAPSQIVDQAVQGRFVVITSRPLLDEFFIVIRRPSLAPHFPDPVGLAMLMETVAVIVEPETTLTVIENDDADNRVLEAAQAGHAQCIVSGDVDLLRLRRAGPRQLTMAGTRPAV